MFQLPIHLSNGDGDHFADDQEFVFFLKADILTGTDSQLIPDLLGNGDLPLDVTLATIMIHLSVRDNYSYSIVRSLSPLVKKL